MKNGISYIRVSTVGQGKSGLSLIAQRRIIDNFCKANKIRLVKEYKEVKSAEDHERRPEVQKAVNDCLSHPELRLVVATQSRLSRNEYFVSSLIRMKVDYVSVDNPTADTFQKHIQAAIDEKFLEENRRNTKAALQVKKDNGIKLGGNVKKMIRTVKRKRNTYLKKIKGTFAREYRKYNTIRELVERLNRMSFTKLNGKKGGWHISEVHGILHDLRIVR